MSSPLEFIKDNTGMVLTLAALTGAAGGYLHAKATTPTEEDNKRLKEEVLLEEEQRTNASIQRLKALKKLKEALKQEEEVRWDGRSIV